MKNLSPIDIFFITFLGYVILRLIFEFLKFLYNKRYVVFRIFSTLILISIGLATVVMWPRPSFFIIGCLISIISYQAYKNSKEEIVEAYEARKDRESYIRKVWKKFTALIEEENYRELCELYFKQSPLTQRIIENALDRHHQIGGVRKRDILHFLSLFNLCTVYKEEFEDKPGAYLPKEDFYKKMKPCSERKLIHELAQFLDLEIIEKEFVEKQEEKNEKGKTIGSIPIARHQLIRLCPARKEMQLDFSSNNLLNFNNAQVISLD